MDSMHKITALLSQLNQVEALKCPFPTALAKVSLSKLESNILQLQAFVEKKKQRPIPMLLPIKANAYGSGMIPVANFLEAKQLCRYFGVAHTVEAILLRQRGVQTPILIMGQAQNTTGEIDAIIKHNIDLSISEISVLHTLNKRAAVFGKTAHIHLEVDTGMGRCGVLYEDLSQILKAIRACDHVELVGVMTHYAVADSDTAVEIEYTEQQIERFNTVKEDVAHIFPESEILFHTSNSGGCLEHPASIFDMVRPGIAAYGYPEHNMGLNLQPIMDIVSTITLIKEYPMGHSIGYGCTYQTSQDKERIGIVPIGYGDGLSRLLSNTFHPIVNGKKAPSVGRISMDQCAVLVDDDAKVGDEVTIIGESNGVRNDAYAMAKAINTIPYEVICNLGNAKRIRHEYIYDQKEED